jgi:hypothetical protein
MSVNGTVELSTALTPNSVGVVTPISFSFADGINTITEANLDTGTIEFTTDANSQIVEWVVLLADSPAASAVGDQVVFIAATNTPSHGPASAPLNMGSISTCTAADVDPITQDCISTTNDFGRNSIAGTWTISTIPLPPAILFFGSGLLGLIGISIQKSAP